MSAMVPVYGSLIIKGSKKITEVPSKLRDEVMAWLVDNGYELETETN